MTDRRNTFAEQFGYWGRVPSDGDVLPFSKVSPASGGEGPPKKKHHYISATYMGGWTTEDGRVWAYRPDEPADPHRSHPLSIGYRKHYYSQTNETGERDDHRWEDLWGCIETVWPATLRAVRDKRLSPAISFNLLGMVAIMRARVPAARERHELLMAHKLRTEVKAAEALGVLPDDLKIYAGMMLRGSTRLAPTNRLVRHRRVSDKARVRRHNRTIAQFGYRLYVAQDRSCDPLVMQYAESVPTVAVSVQGGGREFSIVWDHCFGPRPRLSQYIDTPEKAARLARKMEEEGFFFDHDGTED